MSVSTTSSSLKHNNKSASGEDLKVGTLFFFLTVLSISIVLSMICKYVWGTEIYKVNNSSFGDWLMNF